jgi:hypothetical protein
MNEKIKKMAVEAGFVPWGDEIWSPGDAIDWSSGYDNELVKFHDMVIQMCADHIMESSDRYRKEYFANKLKELMYEKC